MCLIKTIAKKSAGFTLVEVTVAMAIAMMVTVLTIATLQRMILDEQAAADRMDAQANSILAQNYLLRFFSEAVQLQSNGTASLDAFAGGTDVGYVRSYDSTATPVSATPVTIAVFNRENGNLTSGSQFKPTGIFFLPPTATSTGVLFIDLGNGATLSANYGDLFVPDLVQFSIAPLPVPSGVLPYLNVTMVFRHFLPGEGPEVWCPQSAFTPCNGIADIRGFRDVTENLRIDFPDNEYSTSPGNNYETDMGNMYFFPVLGQ